MLWLLVYDVSVVPWLEREEIAKPSINFRHCLNTLKTAYCAAGARHHQTRAFRETSQGTRLHNGQMDRISRLPERARFEIDTLHQILDATQVGVLSTVHDSKPWSVPLLHARVDNQVILHGSTGAGALRQVAAGAEVSYCVWILDGIVVADTLFDSSATYRSAVLRGKLQQLAGADAADALVMMSDRLIPGRSREVPAPTKKQLAATVTLALEITSDNWTAAVQTDGPEAPEDPGIWTGIVPVAASYGPATPSQWVAGIPVPKSVRALCGDAE